MFHLLYISSAYVWAFPLCCLHTLLIFCQDITGSHWWQPLAIDEQPPMATLKPVARGVLCQNPSSLVDRWHDPLLATHRWAHRRAYALLRVWLSFRLMSYQIGSFCDSGLCLTTLNNKKVFGGLLDRLLRAFEELFYNLWEFVATFLGVRDLFLNFERFERSKICICKTSLLMKFWSGL